jgi:hypothetical protein
MLHETLHQDRFLASPGEAVRAQERLDALLDRQRLELRAALLCNPAVTTRHPISVTSRHVMPHKSPNLLLHLVVSAPYRTFHPSYYFKIK